MARQRLNRTGLGGAVDTRANNGVRVPAGTGVSPREAQFNEAYRIVTAPLPTLPSGGPSWAAAFSRGELVAVLGSALSGLLIVLVCILPTKRSQTTSKHTVAVESPTRAPAVPFKNLEPIPSPAESSLRSIASAAKGSLEASNDYLRSSVRSLATLPKMLTTTQNSTDGRTVSEAKSLPPAAPAPAVALAVVPKTAGPASLAQRPVPPATIPADSGTAPQERVVASLNHSSPYAVPPHVASSSREASRGSVSPSNSVDRSVARSGGESGGNHSSVQPPKKENRSLRSSASSSRARAARSKAAEPRITPKSEKPSLAGTPFATRSVASAQSASATADHSPAEVQRGRLEGKDLASVRSRSASEASRVAERNSSSNEEPSRANRSTGNFSSENRPKSPTPIPTPVLKRPPLESSLTFEQEEQILQSTSVRVGRSRVTLSEIKTAYERLVGHEVVAETVDQMMARHGWRKTVLPSSTQRPSDPTRIAAVVPSAPPAAMLPSSNILANWQRTATSIPPIGSRTAIPRSPAPILTGTRGPVGFALSPSGIRVGGTTRSKHGKEHFGWAITIAW